MLLQPTSVIRDAMSAALDDYVKGTLFAVCHWSRAIVYAAYPEDGDVCEPDPREELAAAGNDGEKMMTIV
jgi:hypothetical protein